jgi:nitrogen regulatory protein PII
MTGKKVLPFKITFEEGCFDELEDELTQDEMDALVRGIFELAETGEIFDGAIPVSELPEDEQAEIINMLERKEKRKRH